MKKKADWQQLLFAYIDENKFKPFSWGSWDCCKFSDGCIKKMTGKSLIPKELKWKSEETALEAIKSYGGTLGKSLDKAARFGKLSKIEPNFLQAGDLVVGLIGVLRIVELHRTNDEHRRNRQAWRGCYTGVRRVSGQRLNGGLAGVGGGRGITAPVERRDFFTQALFDSGGNGI